ncbi:MAG: tRNA (adenosine(37)-N6)-threonylcarbamoyltransferase complex ATPase subunit type 1 TsaE [Anaerolineales bacterium]|nr:tRNA (adenosine(37)-N6)-threonylcarbamoyltransferase complex ATPase subunit type 1 TsaE [Anaerolineales bacterium]
MPILDDRTLDFWSHSPEQTVRFGARLGELLLPGDLLTLSGELGAGKTTFVSGLSRGWGSADQVTSPTFVLVNDYRRPDGLHLYHLDGYRLTGAAEAAALGLDDLLADGGVMVVEWPERLGAALPAERLSLKLRWADQTRRGLRFDAAGDRYAALLNEFRQAAFGL